MTKYPVLFWIVAVWGAWAMKESLYLSVKFKKAEDHITMLTATIAAMQAELNQATLNVRDMQSELELLLHSQTYSGPYGGANQGIFASSATLPPVDLTDTNIRFMQSRNLDSGTHMSPAIHTYGSAYVEGNLVVTGSILALVGDEGDNTYMNLTHFLNVQQASSGAACVTPCINGVRNVLTCDCVCGAGWTGEMCDTGVCAHGGEWIPDTSSTYTDGVCSCVEPWDERTHCNTLNCGLFGKPSLSDTCICDEGWSGPKCDVPVVPPTPTSGSCVEVEDGGNCFGMCVYNATLGDTSCVCRDAQFGDMCEFSCTSPFVDSDRCPWRTNWGYDMPCTYVWQTDTTVCSCGGGFTDNREVLHMTELRCVGNNITACQEVFDRSSHICCSPTGTCVGDYNACASNDNDCCYMLSSYGQSTCMASGCGWCSDGNVCVAADLTPGDCLAPPIYNSDAGTVQSSWLHYVYLCSNSNYSDSELCSSNAAYQQYLLIYNQCYTSITTETRTACLKDARASVNFGMWPWLTWDAPTLAVGPPVEIITTYGGSSYALEIDYKYKARNSVLVGWAEINLQDNNLDRNTLFYLTPAPHPSLSAYYIYANYYGDVYCLMLEKMGLLSRYIIFGSQHASWPASNTNDHVYLYAALVQSATSNGAIHRPISKCTPFRVYDDAIFEADYGYGLSLQGITEFASVVEIDIYL